MSSTGHLETGSPTTSGPSAGARGPRHAAATESRCARAGARVSAMSMKLKVLTAVLGILVAGVGAYAATNWGVGLTSGSSGEGQSASIATVSITAVASPSATNLLYPGGTGDVVVTIANTNPYPVTITAVQLPTNTTYATGYTTSALTTTQTGCLAATPSYVVWNYSSATSGSTHTLTTPLTVGASGQANNPLVVTLQNDASMTTASPSACANTYFSMPSMTGITATGGAATSTTSPATDGWTA
ncbi:MAG TPA: hypothetical protein VMU09_01750 [Acidimicrobiales bacterium]|nr:hypothetical protein [Acidimicrobiales bacterium]